MRSGHLRLSASLINQKFAASLVWRMRRGPISRWRGPVWVGIECSVSPERRPRGRVEYSVKDVLGRYLQSSRHAGYMAVPRVLVIADLCHPQAGSPGNCEPCSRGTTCIRPDVAMTKPSPLIKYPRTPYIALPAASNSSDGFCLRSLLARPCAAAVLSWPSDQRPAPPVACVSSVVTQAEEWPVDRP